MALDHDQRLWHDGYFGLNQHHFKPELRLWSTLQISLAAVKPLPKLSLEVLHKIRPRGGRFSFFLSFLNGVRGSFVTFPDRERLESFNL